MMSVIEYEQQEDEDLARIKFSPKANLNRLQKTAIIGIIRASPSLPYILFGPPGTGKTTTLVEATVQLLRDRADNKILVCTPSNTAADLFALALLKTGALETSSILRMFSATKPVKEQNPDLKDVVFAVNDEDSLPIFGFEPKEKMRKKYSVIVSTLSASSYLVSGGLKGVFSYIIVDEAGQADELETLIPIVGLANEKTRVVLAGDPNQLGPVESIELLKPFGLNTSLLERFIKMSCYKSDRRVMTMLKNNYRSHALLVETPSKLFYNGLLIPSADQSQKSTLCQWSGLPTKGVPIIFHSVCDVEELEKEGFSCRNLKEADLLEDYVGRILRETNVTPKEIGVISPYKYQVKTLRKKFSNLPEMLIDSVERFQGSERRVILISTVRNKGLGFLDCDKRLNTTITRAQELMIVVGNHKNLSQSRSWKKVIQFCGSKNVLIGDLESPLKVVQKKLRRKDKCRQALVDDDLMDVHDFSDVSLTCSAKPRWRDINESREDSSKKGQTSRALNFTASNNEVRSIEQSLDLLTLNRESLHENGDALNTSKSSVTSCSASDSFNRQFEEIMNSLKNL